MGYPMLYRRVVNRNRLTGDYDGSGGQLSIIAGDLRRLERDSRDLLSLTQYAEYAGITLEQAKKVLDAFFDDFPQEFWTAFNKRHPIERHAEEFTETFTIPNGGARLNDDGSVSHFDVESSRMKQYQP